MCSTYSAVSTVVSALATVTTLVHVNLLRSALDNSQVVEEYLAKKREAGRVIGPVNPQRHPNVQVSHFGVIPKQHQLGKWRLIVDLSSPEGYSVNDGISKELSSLNLSRSFGRLDLAVRQGFTDSKV